jgi:phage terminase large subunit-like protein
MVDAAALVGRFADALESDWRSIARPEQLAPSGDWTIWLIKAGRGWWKSFNTAQWIREQVEDACAKRIALVDATAGDTRDIMIEGPSGLLSIALSWNRPEYFSTKRSLVWPNGAVATLYSTEEPDRLRGPQFDCA